MKKSIPIALVSILILLLAVGYFINLRAFLASTATFINFIYSFIYLSICLLIMFFSVKAKFKALLHLHLIYWSLAVIFFALYLPATHSPFAIFFLFGAFIFLFPMLGFDYLLNIVNRGILRIDVLYGMESSIIFFLLIALVMLLLGFCAKRKFHV